MISAGVKAYAFVQSRVRAMISRLLDDTTWQKLHSLTDLTTLLGSLNDTVYSTYISNIKDAQFSTRRAEYEIRKRITRDFQVILKNAPAYTTSLLKELFDLYELDNLKAVLRGIAVGENWDTIRYMLFPMEGYSLLPLQEMVERKNMRSAIELLRGTRYCETLQLAYDRFESENTLFPLEIALDLDYWRRVWDLVNALPMHERAATRRLVGTIIDKNNMTWAGRYRQYHHLSEEEIIKYTLPFGYKVNDEIIRSIAMGKEISSVIREIYPEVNPFLQGSGKQEISLPQIEIALQRMILKFCRDTFAGSPFKVNFLIAYLFLLELEVQDLTLLIEAKSLGISYATYEPYLIHTRAASMKTKEQ